MNVTISKKQNKNGIIMEKIDDVWYEFASQIKDIKEIQGIKSAIDIREQEARIANLRKNAETEDTNKEIKVTIVGDLDEYSN